MRAAISLLLVLGVVAVGCGEGEGGAPDRLTVVATTTQAADLARNVAGAHAKVVGLLAPNTDPHEYEVRPSDVRALADADLVVRSGGDLDEWLAEAIEGSGTDAPVLTLSTADDPHWWQDPRQAIRAVAAIERALAEADPGRAGDYAAAASAYTRRLRALDRAVAACIDRVPVRQRKLVTTHDALAAYARRYGIEVVGAVIPSLSTSGQPSAGETAELIETIREEGVKAIFPERSVEAKVEQAIARETGARIGGTLWADTLGPPGSGGETYLQSIAANTRTLVEGFSGGKVTCRIDA